MFSLLKRKSKTTPELPAEIRQPDIIQVSCVRYDKDGYDWRLDFQCRLCGGKFWLGSTKSYKELDTIHTKCPTCSSEATTGEMRAFIRQECRKAKDRPPEPPPEPEEKEEDEEPPTIQ